jgi:hypothetical protein
VEARNSHGACQQQPWREIGSINRRLRKGTNTDFFGLSRRSAAGLYSCSLTSPEALICRTRLPHYCEGLSPQVTQTTAQRMKMPSFSRLHSPPRESSSATVSQQEVIVFFVSVRAVYEVRKFLAGRNSLPLSIHLSAGFAMIRVIGSHLPFSRQAQRHSLSQHVLPEPLIPASPSRDRRPRSIRVGRGRVTVRKGRQVVVYPQLAAAAPAVQRSNPSTPRSQMSALLQVSSEPRHTATDDFS